MPGDAPDHPNIDQRLEALTQTVELLAQMHKELERETAQRFGETLGFINRLAPIAQAHEDRLDDLQGL
ncbi:MAG: hypothetical protein ABSC23_05590 [Bryobacteraceae bacterium]|jgi:hypothetical protein